MEKNETEKGILEQEPECILASELPGDAVLLKILFIFVCINRFVGTFLCNWLPAVIKYIL